MILSKINIKNFRLLTNTTLDIDPKTTLIVGRNNTAKTSLFECIKEAINGGFFSYNDYPIMLREKLFTNLLHYAKAELNIEQLCKNVESINVEFVVDYSMNGDDDNLSSLSPFIIDVDEEITTAIIRVECGLIEDEKKIKEAIGKEEVITKESIRNSVCDSFNKLFETKIYAVNPLNPMEKQIKKQNELQALFPCELIPAERDLGEDENKRSSLSRLISEFFSMDESELEPVMAATINRLHKVIDEANIGVQKQSDELLSSLIDKSIGFGYPNVEELQLGVTTHLNIDEQIKNQTQLSYVSGENDEKLPSKYNGLGYKNLIKIEFLLAAYQKKIAKAGNACIPLLLIEEPESHMHPQLQQAFANYLEDFLKKLDSISVQTFLTSHSSHIANTMDFSKIRYAQKTTQGIIYKNLNTFALDNPENIDFIRKYLTLTKCDLFFADKAIFVEGASERLLLPDIIEKCERAGDFAAVKYTLPMQYYTVIEIGGAYAHKFMPFTQFLGIPCLVLTDIDPVAKQGEGGRYSSTVVSKGETTSNETIKWWIRKRKGLGDGETIQFEEIVSMQNEDKTIGKCHIEFQTTEEGICANSLEEAFKNVNREKYGLSGDITEENISFTGRSKTDFALDLIYKNDDYNIPNYIRSGLIWLNEQKVLE